MIQILEESQIPMKTENQAAYSVKYQVLELLLKTH